MKQHFQLPGIFISLLFYISSKTTIPFSKFKFVKSYTRKNRIPFGIACGSGFISVACAADSLIRWFTRSACTISCIKSRWVARIYIAASDWSKPLFDQTQGRNKPIRSDCIYPCDSAEFETRYRALIRKRLKPVFDTKKPAAAQATFLRSTWTWFCPEFLILKHQTVIHCVMFRVSRWLVPQDQWMQGDCSFLEVNDDGTYSRIWENYRITKWYKKYNWTILMDVL